MRLSYANVVATLALILSLGGSPTRRLRCQRTASERDSYAMAPLALARSDSRSGRPAWLTRPWKM